MHANNREDIQEAGVGDIVAVVGLKNTTTGETLCSESDPIILERMTFPDPVIKVAVEATSKDNHKKMMEALIKLSAEDPSFRYSTDEASSQTIIEGIGELHLDIIIDRMKREFNVEATVGAPQVAFREAITKTIELSYTHKKQSGGTGQYAKIDVIFEPNAGGGFEFVNQVKGGNVPKEYLPGVIKGFESEMSGGIIAGFPMNDLKVTLKDGAYHDVDSSVLAFEIAARGAFREGIVKASPRLLEPMMRVEITTPEDYMGSVVGDLNSRRGNVEEFTDRGPNKVVRALVPLSEMFSYVSSLRGMSKGRANYSMELASYDPVPMAIQEKLKKGSKGE